jgi:r-opsin
MNSNITFAAQKSQPYDPWNIPDSFTLYQFAPEDIRSFLHPFWHSHKAPHPVWFYFLGLYFTILGRSLALTKRHAHSIILLH